jgi:taurine dioxygenase
MTTTTVSWTPVTDGFGAQVDMDLSVEIPASVGEELRELLNDRQLLVFRGQDIDYETQRRVISLVGDPLVEVKYVSTEHSPMGDLLAEPADPDPRTTMFHSDMAFLKNGPIPEGISLYAEDVSGNTSPGFQGTSFTSARNAYLNMSEEDRAELEGRTAIQLHALELETEEQLALKQVPFDEARDKVTFWAEHSLFHPDPRTGEPVLLYIPWFTQSIVGLSPEESQQWFEKFDALLYRDQEVYTHRWENGDLLIWDNTAIQHCKETVGPVSGPLPKRILRRCSFGPEEPNIYNQVDPRGNAY